MSSNQLLSPEQIFQHLLDNLCIDMQRYVCTYLPSMQYIRRHCIYTKYYDELKLYQALWVFTPYEVNRHFHAADLFGSSIF